MGRSTIAKQVRITSARIALNLYSCTSYILVVCKISYYVIRTYYRMVHNRTSLLVSGRFFVCAIVTMLRST